MAAGAKIPIIDTAVLAWRDAFRAINAMPAVAGIAFVITVILAVPTLFIFSDPVAAKPSVGSHVVSFVLSVIQAFLIAPLAIAVHRFVLLGEVTGGYSINPSSPRYLRFVTFSLVIILIYTVPGWIADMIHSPLPSDSTDPAESLRYAAYSLLMIFLIIIPITIVVLRRLILFPAIAVDALGANWSNARKDTKGHTWRVAFVFVCTSIPLMVLSLPFIWPLDLSSKPSEFNLSPFLIFSTIIAVPTVCAFAAAASHLFRGLADNLARPPGSAVA